MLRCKSQQVAHMRPHLAGPAGVRSLGNCGHFAERAPPVDHLQGIGLAADRAGCGQGRSPCPAFTIAPGAEAHRPARPTR